MERCYGVTQGNTALEKSARRKPYPWVPDVGWEDLVRLSEVCPQVFSSVLDDLGKHEADWKRVGFCYFDFVHCITFSLIFYYFMVLLVSFYLSEKGWVYFCLLLYEFSPYCPVTITFYCVVWLIFYRFNTSVASVVWPEALLSRDVNDLKFNQGCK